MEDKLNLPEKIKLDNFTLVRHHQTYSQKVFNAIDENRNFLREFLFWVDKTKTVEDSIKTTDYFISEWSQGKNYAYLLIDKDENILGSIDIHEIDNFNRNAEFGYWLREDKTGNGYISQAIKYLEKLAFEKGLVRIYIRCDVSNIPSNNVAIKNGYKFEGCLKKAFNTYGDFHDVNLFAKTI